MRKTRIFAALLCLMMIATAIPMMQASADDEVIDGVLETMDVLKHITFPSDAAATAYGTLYQFNNPESYTNAVVDGKMQLRVSTTGKPTSGSNFYADYKLKDAVNLNAGEFLRIKGTVTADKPVYFEFDINNPGSRLRLMASATKVANGGTPFGNQVSHVGGTSYDYLIQRYVNTSDTTDANGTYYYKVWRKVGNDDYYTFVGETKRQATNSNDVGDLQLKVMDGSGFDVESVTIYGTAAESETSKKQATLTAGLNPIQEENFSGAINNAGRPYFAVDYAKTGTRTYIDGKSVNLDYAENSGYGTVGIENGMLKVVGGSVITGVTQNGKGVEIGETADAYPAAKLSMNTPLDFCANEKFSFKVRFDEFGKGYNLEDMAGEIQIHTGATRLYFRFKDSSLSFRNITNATEGFSSCKHIAGITYEYLFEYSGGSDATSVTDNTVKVWRRIDGETNYTYIGSGTIQAVQTNAASSEVVANAGTIMYVDDINLYGVSADPTIALSADSVTVTGLNAKGADKVLNTNSLILASYAENDGVKKLLDAKIVEIHESGTVTIESTGLDTTGANVVYAYLWDGFENMKPVAVTKSVPLAD